MPRTLVLVLLLLSTLPARADWFYRLVEYTCDQKRDELVINYKGAYNDEGKVLRETKRDTEWVPESLIASMKDDDHIGKLKAVTQYCKLKHGTYVILLGPTPGNYNIQGSCGAQVTAWVEVRLGAALVLPRFELEGDCHDSSYPVTTKVEFGKGKPPKFTKISTQEFIR